MGHAVRGAAVSQEGLARGGRPWGLAAGGSEGIGGRRRCWWRGWKLVWVIEGNNPRVHLLTK